MGPLLRIVVTATMLAAALVPVSPWTAAEAALPPTPDSVGLFDAERAGWYLRSPEGSSIEFTYGNPFDQPFMGDWDCDGVDTPGLYRRVDTAAGPAGKVYLRNSSTTGIADIEYFYGDPGDVAVPGDWDGDGCDTVAVYRPATGVLHIKNVLGAGDRGVGVADVDVPLGITGARPFPGDFDADGRSDVGLQRPGAASVDLAFRLDDPSFASVPFGDRGDTVIAGAWGRRGLSGLGAFRPSEARFYLRDTPTPGVADRVLDYGEGRWAPLAWSPGPAGPLPRQVGCVPGPPPSPPLSAGERPNLVVIFTDDQEFDTVRHMPQLTRDLMCRGATFEDFFVPTSVCCPSRVTILRGQYAHNHGVVRNQNAPGVGGHEAFRDLGLERSTIATWLHDAGYRTMFAGKYVNGYPAAGTTHLDPLPGWDEWVVALGIYFEYLLFDTGTAVRNPPEYQTDLFTRRAEEFIRASAQSAQPFFLMLAPFAPHLGVLGPDGLPRAPQGAARHQHAFDGARAPRPPSFNELDVSDKAGVPAVAGLLGPSHFAKQDEYYEGRLESLLAVDDMIATVVRTLAATGELDNTYIFFTSDNGYHLGQHRLPWEKGSPYEEDIRVGLVARGPGVPAGTSLPHLTSTVDLAPTLADLAGIPAPDFVDGRSLAPLLGASPPPPQSWRRALPIEFWHQDDARLLYRGVRTVDSKFFEWIIDGGAEFYDLAVDPWEMESTYRELSPERRTALAAHAERLFTCAGAGCRVAEDAPPP